MRALVTGVTRGIGRAVVDHLVVQGWEVAAVARVPHALEAAAEGWGPRVTPFVADVTDAARMREIARDAGDLDLVVANAGVLAAPGPLWDVDLDEWWSGFTVNVLGVVATAHAVLPRMVERGTGRLVLMTSGIGNGPGPWNTQYAASKSAVTRIGESLELELAATGVHCFHVSPGAVRTGMTDWPDRLLEHYPDLGTMSDQMWTPVERVLALVDEIAAGDLDALAGRFLHANDDRTALLAALRDDAAGARTLGQRPAFDGDPYAD